MNSCDYLIVGAGFFGCVLAERIASQLGRSVLVIDRRDHIGGNCHSQADAETGIEFHSYGTHIFHTSSPQIWAYINRFTEFNSYFHQVLTLHKGRVFQMPINLETINSFYGVNLRPFEVAAFLEREREPITQPRNLEEKAISLIGRPLYEAFIRGYTAKQWNRDPRELPASIINRLPVRFNYNEAYFNNARWQGIPLEGYTRIFERLLDAPQIRLELGCDYFELRDRVQVRYQTIYTGPIDRLFEYCFGRLSWRSIELRRRVEPVADWQGTSVMNYADIEVPHTRIHEPRHLHPERAYRDDRTLLFEEYSLEAGRGEEYYPVRDEDNRQLLKQYQALAAARSDLLVGGRLGDYAYYDMDQTIGAALHCFETRLRR